MAASRGVPIGFGACEAFEDALHLWELAVHADAQGQGVGRAIVAAAAEAGRARGLPAMTLTTFRDIAWNGPLYAHLGFRELAPVELNPRLRAVAAREAARGLDVAARCAMRLDL